MRLYAVVLVCVRLCWFVCACVGLCVLVFVYVYKQHKHIPLYAFVCVLQVLDGPNITAYFLVVLDFYVKFTCKRRKHVGIIRATL